MRKLNKYVAIGCSLLMLTASLTACKSNSDSKESTGSSTAEYTNTTIYGKVTAVDGSNVTLALGESIQGGMGGAAPSGTPDGNMQGGAAPSGAPSGDMQGGAAPSGAPSGDMQGGAAPSGAPDGNMQGGAAPSGTPSGDMQQGAAPSGAPDGDIQGGSGPDGMHGGMDNNFSESGETLTITIDDESVIKVQSGSETTQGSMENITVDSILAIEYATDGSISTITVQSTGRPAQGAADGSKSGS